MSNSAPYNYSYIFKYIIIGDMGVGKSCLLHQFTEKKCKCIFISRNVLGLRKYSSWRFLLVYNWWASLKSPLRIFLHQIISSHGRLSSHNRSRIRHSNNRSGKSEDQTADLGYCWTRKVRFCLTFFNSIPSSPLTLCAFHKTISTHARISGDTAILFTTLIIQIPCRHSFVLSWCSGCIDGVRYHSSIHVQSSGQLAHRCEESHQSKYCENQNSRFC